MITRIGVSAWWAIYVIVYASGLLMTAYLMRRFPFAFITLFTCFAIPVVLVAIGAQANEAALRSSTKPMPANRFLSLNPDRQVAGIQRGPYRASTIVARTMLFPFALWVLPADPSLDQIKLILILWWLGWAAVAAFVVPRLRAHSPEHNEPGSTSRH